MLDVGDVLADRYELVESVGYGGMARVLRAHDRLLERDVAVKILPAHRAEDGSFQQRFRREARAAASLNHPNVVTVHDTGSDGDNHYIVMEYVDGPSLERVLKTEGALDPERATEIARQVCAALAAAHRRGLVHRDVKPGNILFDPSGRVKVTDFGIVRAVGATTTTDTVYGSAPFISPEQARGDDVDRRSDVYSLGCVLYAMLTGAEPFRGDNPLSVVHQHLHDEPPVPSAARADLPRELDEVVGRALRKDPDERYPSAEAMTGALDHAAGATGQRTRRLEHPTDSATVPVASRNRGPTTRTGDAGAEPSGGASGGDGAGVDAGGGPSDAGRGGDGAPKHQQDADRAGRRRLLLVLAVVGALTGALALAGVLAGETGSVPAASRASSSSSAPARTPSASPSPSTSPSTSPTPSSAPTSEPAQSPAPPDSPEEASGRLLEVVRTGEQRGEITEKAAEDVRKRADEALEKLYDGDVDQAFAKLDEALAKLEDRREKDEVTPSRAEAIAAAIDDVAEAMR